MKTIQNIEAYDYLTQEELEERVAELATMTNPNSVGSYYQDAWEIFKKNPGGFILYTIVLGIASNFIILSPPIAVGAGIVTEKYLRDEEVEFGDFFKGFDKFGELLGGFALVMIFVLLGVILCIIPGIYLAIAYSFVPLMIYFVGAGVWPSMEASRKLLTDRFWEVFVFLLVGGLINMAGMIACYVGLLVTFPLTQIATYLYFRSIFIKPNGEDEYLDDDEEDDLGLGDVNIDDLMT